jgi:eukaryotic-like serine/threonine-protein kinase
VVKARRRAAEETTTGTIKGKLQYMAPEQALGQGSIDRRADIWAVGATLYRLLARKPVYRGNTPLSTFNRLTSTLAPEPLPAHVPGALSTIVSKALAFEPERRFATAAELGSALEALLQGPYQTSSREVAACVEQFLGPALAARRRAISEALEDRSTAEKTQPDAPERESGASQAETVPQRPSSAPPSAPTRLDRSFAASASPGSPVDEGTRPLHQVPPRSTTSRRSLVVAAGGVLALAGALTWAFPGSAPKAPAPAPAPVAAARPEPSAATALPPMFTIDEPLSVQALPVLGEPPMPAATPAKSAAPLEAATSAISRPATTKKKVAVASRRPTPPTKAKQNVVDDGF